jgi:hypothetical protein
MDAGLKAALIGAIVATLTSTLFLYLYESYKERRDRGRVASALLVEVIAQAEFIGVLSDAAHKENVLAVRETFIRFLPTRPIVFGALADRLPLLGARTCSCVVACYGSVEWARALIGGLPTTFEFAEAKRGPHNAPSMPEFHSATYTANLIEQQSKGLLDRLKHAAKAAAFNAILAIKALDEAAPHKRLPNDETVLSDTLRKLEKAAMAREPA